MARGPAWRNRIALGVSVLLIGGCDISLSSADLDRILAAFDSVDINIQSRDPRVVVIPEDADVEFEADVIVNIEKDIVVERLPDLTLLGFENATGFDINLRYEVDGNRESIFVFDGETLLLEYNCLNIVDLVSEEDFDPVTGVLIQEFDFSGVIFLNPDDFRCGEAFIITITPNAIVGGVETVELVD